MFARVLLDSSTVLMTIEWFGLGALRVTDKRSGFFAQATPEVRSHFLQTLDEMRRLGVDLGPADSRSTKVMVHYGMIVLDPEGLNSRITLSKPPSRVAAMLFQDGTA